MHRYVDMDSKGKLKSSAEVDKLRQVSADWMVGLYVSQHGNLCTKDIGMAGMHHASNLCQGAKTLYV